MKTFGKISICGLLLGFIFYLVITFSFNEYYIQKALNLSDNVFAILSLSFYLLILIFISIVIPVVSNKWLNGSKWSLILSVLWIPYLFLWIFLNSKVFTSISNFDENNYGGGLFALFLIIGSPIYIFVLNLIGIYINKNRKYKEN